VTGRGDFNEHLLRWLLISVGGALLPFIVLFIAYRVPAGAWPSLVRVLGRGELLIPAVVLNVEVAWAFSGINVHAPGRSVWYPVILTLTTLSGLSSAVVYGVAAALKETPADRLTVPSSTIEAVSSFVATTSIIMFLEAFVLGTVGVILAMWAPRSRD